MKKIIDESKQGSVTAVDPKTGNKKKLYIESYGCQMNFNDSEIVASILADEGYNTTDKMEEADLILVNTCAIRDKAEQTIRKRLEKYNAVKRERNPEIRVGVLGCMASRLKEKLLEQEKIVDLIAGPDSYKELPKLLSEVESGREAANVILSRDETYGDVAPVRLGGGGITAFVSITRGCDNMCTFCVVPFTRGRERSRDPESILKEIADLAEKGYKEITLLGQNVDSYLWYGGGLKKDFKNATEEQKKNAVNFAGLLEMAARSQPRMRIRFSTSNPQDMTEEVLHTMAKYKNICRHIHLPFQSGSSRILKLMNRQHTREEYLSLISKVREIMPDCGISHDIISGFSTETEEDHQLTLSLMEEVKFDFGFMFMYSERPGTLAARRMEDDVPEEVKKRRLTEIIELQREHSAYHTRRFVGKTVEVLIESESRKSDKHWSGRTSQNTVVVFPKSTYKAGEFVMVKIVHCTSATLLGEPVGYSENN